MKKILALFLLFAAVFFSTGCDDEDRSTPIIFVHGLTSYGASSYYYLYEQFAAQHFPERKMSVVVLPRIGTGPNFGGDVNYAWYTGVTGEAYDRTDWDQSGDTVYNVPEVEKEIDRILRDTGAESVDLIGHSNGTKIIRQILGDPEYAPLVRKVVFISGFGDVSGAYPVNSFVSYLRDAFPDSVLPTETEYYAVSSESDANFYIEAYLAGPPLNDNPPEYKYLRYFNMDIGTNLIVPAQDHHTIVCNDVTFGNIYRWLAGFEPEAVDTPPMIRIGGKIIKRGPNAYEQSLQTSGSVCVRYYDPSTGAETGPAGFSGISSEGEYHVCGLLTCRYLKIIIDANGARTVYFLADRITGNSGALDFLAPSQLGSDNSDGCVSVEINSRYEYFSRNAYVNKPGTVFAGKIAASGTEDAVLDTNAVTTSLPLTETMYIQNFGATNTSAGGTVYNFDSDASGDYRSKDISVTANLNGKGDITALINGADRMNNIRNVILYLYGL